ncbi:hypothetical protein [Stygiobacter electus]|uniref:Uncharacterized protein n=1 Tax=Stygiobacter electus TaxID=3032292 RepID=A0AAE3P2K3_9BACT|nr:hypothetical protein [Stygiobacter electus]MDF1612622.1 hypothetical protein [Stygiobacter electus]
MKTFSVAPMHEIESNANQGKYKPKFFALKEFNLSRVDFHSHYYAEKDIAKEIFKGEFSLAYLREDKLRTVDAFKQNQKIDHLDFLETIAIDIKTTNIYKTGKYLSRVFRPMKHAKYYKDLDIHLNENPNLKGKITDGITLINKELAKSIGWNEAEANKSAQVTIFNENGLVKGHCVISDKIKHDIVIYGRENIKTEIRFNKEYTYIAIEPVKLTTSLRIDIQTLLNLWEIFEGEQYFQWAIEGINKIKEELKSGKINEIIEELTEEENEKWLLKKAIRHKIDYRYYPGLYRLAWQMYKNSIIKYAERKGITAFRIPVKGGLRGYLRVDLRDHDEDGNFSLTKTNTTTIDKYGNIWISGDKIAEYLTILGGGDQDDSGSIIPIENNKAIIYRNPNQKGEYIITELKTEGIEITERNKIIGKTPQKKITEQKEEKKKEQQNPFIKKYIEEKEKNEQIIEYTRANLLRTYSKISMNGANIGIVANAEMIKSAVGINNKEQHEILTNKFNWNLERVIDSVVKDGITCKEDIEAVEKLNEYIIYNEIPIPKCLRNRIPESKRERVAISDRHILDQLLEGVKYLIKNIEIEIVGSGAVSRGNRIKGIIDYIETPIIEIARANEGNKNQEEAKQLLREYNQKISELIETTKEENEEERKKGIEEIQTKLLEKINIYTIEERKEISKAWAYEIYKTEKSVHDSILWISSKENLRGTGEDTIEMLAEIGLAK